MEWRDIKRKVQNFLWFIKPRIDNLQDGWFIRWLGFEFFIARIGR
jgi:hypothetical protein